MMDVEELEVEIDKEKKALGKLEDLYEKEEDEKKVVKLEYGISRKEERIDRFIDRQNALLDKEAETNVEEEEGKKEDLAKTEDEDVCSECGGDLIYSETVEKGDVFVCEKCGELFLDEWD